MQQVATFSIPDQQEQANEFLRTHKTDQQFFNKDVIIFFYDNGIISPEYEKAELRELLRGNANAKFQQKLAVFVMQRQLADLKSERSQLHDVDDYKRVKDVDTLIKEISNSLSQTEQAIKMQDIKAEYVQDCIDALNSDGNE